MTFVLVSGGMINLTAERMSYVTVKDTLQTVSSVNSRPKIYIKDKSQYDQKFIDGLADYYESIRLENNYIITSDTTYFPAEPALDSATTFSGMKDGRKYVLTVTRTNLTNLYYIFQIIDNDNMTFVNKSGVAILGSLFFLASEIDTDDQTGISYGCSEYWDTTNSCFFAIRIGENDNNGKLRAALTYGCEEMGKLDLDLDDCPTLRTD